MAQNKHRLGDVAAQQDLGRLSAKPHVESQACRVDHSESLNHSLYSGKCS